jgi:hypothetical protein
MANDVVRYGAVTDLENGNYSVRICPVIAGVHELHILLKGQGISNQRLRILDEHNSITESLGRGTYYGQYVATSPFTLNVRATKASIITTTAIGTGLVNSTVGVPAYFKITVRDPFDNVLRSNAHKPNITILLDRSPNAKVSVWDFYNGSYLLSYTAEKAGVNLVSVFINGFQMKDSPFSVPTLDGQTSANYSFAEGSGLVVGVTGKTSYFQLFSFDLNGNRKSGYEDVYTFTVSGTNFLSGILSPCPSPRPAKHPICDPIDRLDGYYWGSFEPTITGTIKISVFLKNRDSTLSEISNSPFFATIFPSDPKAEATDISGELEIMFLNMG